MRIGTVYPERESYRGPSIQSYFFLLPGQKYFMAFPIKIGISQYSFLSKLYFISQHRCVDNPDSVCVSGRTRVLNTNGQL